MKYTVFIFLFAASICLAQEYHNEEINFTIDVPSGWNISFEDQWPDKLKADIEKYNIKPLFVIDSSENRSSRIIVFGNEEGKGQFSFSMAQRFAEKNAKNMMTSDILAKELLGQDARQYRKIDSFYDYDSSKHLWLAKIIYEDKNDEASRFITSWAMVFTSKKKIEFRGYSKDRFPEEFWKTFQDVVDSVKVGSSYSVKENLSSENMLKTVIKWGGILLTISIILGFIKILLGR